MAVEIEIGKTRHLAFSPLNEKHNILYHRARQNVNQRHIGKPWFNLNPCLDREGSKGLSLEDYKPENDREILPLESLVIVEEYFDDNPQFAKEFKIGDFWEFLFSENWNHGYSVRVLEGRLQDLLHETVIGLARGGHVAHHSTVAYAKNRRQRNSIYRHSQKDPQSRPYDETLLLEFIYYGRVVKHEVAIMEHLPDDCSYGYPDVTTCSTTHGTSDLESSDKDGKYFELALRPHPPAKEQTTNTVRRQRLLHRRVKSRSNNLDLIHEEGPYLNSASPSPIPRGVAKRHKDKASMYSVISEDFHSPPPHIDLSKFACTEKVSYLGEFELSDDSSSSEDETETDRRDFGQEYYLGDCSSSKRLPDVHDSVQVKLRKRKEIVSKERELRKQMLKAQNAVSEKKTITREFSELDVKKYLKEHEIHVSATEGIEALPSLDEYIKIMRQQEKEDIRYKNRMRQRFLELRKKYLNIDPDHEKMADIVAGVTGSQACKIHVLNKTDLAWKLMSDRAKRNFLVQKLFMVGGKVHVNPKKKKAKPKMIISKKLKIPLIYITTTSGITYLHPVSKHIMQSKAYAPSEEEETIRRPSKRRGLLLPGVLTDNDRKSKSPNEQKSGSRKSVVDEKGFPKMKPVSGMESSDENSDSESDGLENSLFNTKKLNLKYSVEKIRNIIAARKAKEPPAEENFMDVLKKYYRMQSVLKAFSKGRQKNPAGGGRKKAIFGNAGFGSRRTGTLGTLAKRPVEKKADEITIGKLKWFSFMDNKKTRAQLSDDTFQAHFENYPMGVFRANVERALELFVVRREMVLSDYSTKASVSITFTKKSVFTKTKAPN